MIGLLLGAFRARRAQTLTVLLLAMVAVAAAVAAPWYVLASAERAAVSDVTAAPVVVLPWVAAVVVLLAVGGLAARGLSRAARGTGGAG